MRLLLLPLVLGFAMMSGCSSTLALKPDNGSDVDLSFRNLDGTGGFIAIYQDDYDCFGFSLAGTKSSDMPVTKTVNTNGRKFITINASYYTITKYCNANYTFPIAGYKGIRLTISRNDKFCATSVEVQDGLRNGWVKIGLTRRNFIAPRKDSQGPYCSPDERYRGSSSLIDSRPGLGIK